MKYTVKYMHSTTTIFEKIIDILFIILSDSIEIIKERKNRCSINVYRSLFLNFIIIKMSYNFCNTIWSIKYLCKLIGIQLMGSG